MSDKAATSIIGVRELSRETRAVVDRLEATGEPAIVTRDGKPVAALIAVDDERLKDFVLSAAPEFATSAREADEALAEGRTRPMGEVLAEMASEDAQPAVVEAGSLDPSWLVCEYAERVAAFSAEAARREIPDDADAAKIERLQRVNSVLFGELLSRTLDGIAERVRVVTENAVLAGRERGGIDASVELLEDVTTAERLTHYSCRSDPVRPEYGPRALVAMQSLSPFAFAAAAGSKQGLKSRWHLRQLQKAVRKR
jgi:antitoxin (DNA-binding transcriptional repressor) of toxin-antitoxin stability system